MYAYIYICIYTYKGKGNTLTSVSYDDLLPHLCKSTNALLGLMLGAAAIQ